MSRIKILVVDDESRMRKLVRDFLERNEFKVTHSKDCHLILYISGQEDMKTSLQSFIRARKI